MQKIDRLAYSLIQTRHFIVCSLEVHSLQADLGDIAWYSSEQVQTLKVRNDFHGNHSQSWADHFSTQQPNGLSDLIQ